MRYFITSAALVAIASASHLVDSSPNAWHEVILARQTSEESYINSICSPNNTDPVPPCQEIVNIEEQCQPNGTSPIDYLASAECMCGGSFFSDWNGCQECQYVHGARSEAVLNAFENIITTVSNILCTGTPTASFAAIFSSVAATAPQTASGSTVLSDMFPSQSAVSLYYTASGSEGAGAITGSAADATATSSAGSGPSSASVVSLTASSGSMATSTATSTGSSGSTGSSISSAAATSATSKSGAHGLRAAGGLGVVVVIGAAAML